MARMERSIEVNVPAPVLYQQLLRFSAYPRFMEGVHSVHQLDDTHLHWSAEINGKEMEWDSEITLNIPNECIAWRNISGPKNEGQVLILALQPDKCKIVLTVDSDDYAPPQTDDALGNAAHRHEQDLSRLKKLVENQQHDASHESRVSHAQAASNARAGIVSDDEVLSATAPKRAATDETVDADSSRRSAIDRAPAHEQSGRSTRAALQERNHMTRSGMRRQHAWNAPMQKIRNIGQAVNRQAHDFFSHFGSRWVGAFHRRRPKDWTPHVEVLQRDMQLLICADLPGIKREDVHVKIIGNHLTIEGERYKEDLPGQKIYQQTDRVYGHFYREIQLHERVNFNTVRASLRDGILEISVPVPTRKSQGRRIDIQMSR